MTTDRLREFSTILLSSAGILLLIVSIIVHPRIRPYFMRNQDRLLTDFLVTQAKTDHVDPKSFWQFREFYSVGHFSFPLGSSHMEETHTIDALGFGGAVPILTYNSSRMNSTEYLVSFGDKVVGQPLRVELRNYLGFDVPEDDYLFFGDRMIIYATDLHTIKLFFEIPGSEMKHVIGFFNFTKKEEAFTDKSIWISENTFYYDGDATALKALFSPDALK